MAVENRIVVIERIKDTTNGITIPYAVNLEPVDEALGNEFGRYEGQTWYRVMASAQSTEEMVTMGWIIQEGLLFGLIANEVLDGKTDDANRKGSPQQDTYGNILVRGERVRRTLEAQERREREQRSSQGIFGVGTN